MASQSYSAAPPRIGKFAGGADRARALPRVPRSFKQAAPRNAAPSRVGGTSTLSGAKGMGAMRSVSGGRGIINRIK